MHEGNNMGIMTALKKPTLESPAPLGSLHSTFASRYRACFTAFVVSPSGSWPGRSPQVTPGPLVARSPNPGCMHGDRWFSQVPELPL